jgi:hypothetical protein
VPDTAVFERDLFGLIEAGVVEIAVDLSGVGSLDPSLLLALSAADVAVGNASGHLYVLVTRPYLLHQIHAVGFRRVTPLFMSTFPSRAADVRRRAVERGVGEREATMNATTNPAPATEYSALYSATTTPELVDVPKLTYLMIDGSGAPASEEFDYAMKAIYRVAYSVRAAAPPAYRRPVMPLEALWGSSSGVRGARDLTWRWTLMISQPPSESGAAAATLGDLREIFEATVTKLRTAAPGLPIEDVRLDALTEGRCVQALHVGRYADEHATILRMLAHAEANGYRTAGRHHEIYLSDPNRTTPERLRTILRLPVAPAR